MWFLHLFVSVGVYCVATSRQFDRNWFSPFIVHVPGIELRLPDLAISTC